MAFLKLIIDAIPLLSNEGYRINLPALIQTIWSDGLGERQINQIIQQMSPEEMATKQLLQMEQQGGQPGAPGAGGGQASNPQLPPEAAMGSAGQDTGSFADILNSIRSLPEQVEG